MCAAAMPVYTSAEGLASGPDYGGSVVTPDYILVKRSCFGTYTLSLEEKERANVDRNDGINSIDYVLIKRIVFGTYTAQ